MTGFTETDQSAGSLSSRRFFWAGLALVSLAFVVAAAISWRRWLDLIVDFGGQLYIPWRLAHGAILYHDLFYFAGGPLSQYFNALLFKIFGTSFFTLIVTNLTLVAATLLLVYRRFAVATDVLTATMICLGIVLVFAFSQYTAIANYNYVTPYSHELLHGLLLSIVTVVLLSDWLAEEKLRFAAAAGFCSGLVFLTKPDVFVANATVCVVAFIMFLVIRRQAKFAAKSLAVFLATGLIPVLGFFIYFSNVEGWREGLRSVVFGWLPVFQTAVVKNPFYQWCMGFDEPVVHLRETAIHFFGVFTIVAIYASVFQRAARLTQKIQWLLFFALMFPLLLAAWQFDWSSCGASLPLLCLSTCLLLRWKLRDSPAQPALVFPFLWSVFALLLLLKMGFAPRIWHYGFALAMPAFVSAVYLLLWLLPRLLEKHQQVPAKFMRLTAGLVLLTGYLRLFHGSGLHFKSDTLAVGSGADKIIASGPPGNSVEARTMNAALAWIETNVPPNATLAALPQGIMLNYLSRRINPTPCLDWNPTMFTVFGQEKMTAAFEQNPPDYICLVEWKSFEFGVGYFGSEPGYGMEIMQWIEKNYQPVQLIGSEPLHKGLFGIKILKKLPALPAQKQN